MMMIKKKCMKEIELKKINIYCDNVESAHELAIRVENKRLFPGFDVNTSTHTIVSWRFQYLPYNVTVSSDGCPDAS